KPTIIIIPGSFSLLYTYDAVTAELVAHGYPVEGIELETVGRRDKAPGLSPPLASRLADEGKDVVLVPHSYGGLVACEASKGLAKSVREKEGKQGGIVRIVFVTAVVGKEGQGLTDVMGDTKLGYITVELWAEINIRAYKDIPASYLFCEADKCVTPEVQNRIIAAMESEMGGKTVDRHSVKADHAVNVTQPKAMASVIRAALGEKN
ncbi:hypothetical protein B0H14DRAFT_2765628, partial [Mycena olivaceomarginata]